MKCVWLKCSENAGVWSLLTDACSSLPKLDTPGCPDSKTRGGHPGWLNLQVSRDCQKEFNFCYITGKTVHKGFFSPCISGPLDSWFLARPLRFTSTVLLFWSCGSWKHSCPQYSGKELQKKYILTIYSFLIKKFLQNSREILSFCLYHLMTYLSWGHLLPGAPPAWASGTALTPGQPQCHPHMLQPCHRMPLMGMWPLEEPSFGKITLEPSFATFHHISRIRVFLGQKALPRNTSTLLSSGGSMVCRHIAAILLCYPKNISGSTDARLCKQEGLWGEAEGSWGHVLLHCPSMRLLFQILQAEFGCCETIGHGEYRKEGMHCLDY